MTRMPTWARPLRSRRGWGERNGFRQHFGPTNVAAWRVSIGIELGEGVRAYEDATRAPIDVTALGSAERSSSLHLDLARVLVQDGGTRDGEAIRHLDTADHIAPQRVRPDPIARDLALTLDRRTHRRVWSASWTACATGSASAGVDDR